MELTNLDNVCHMLLTFTFGFILMFLIYLKLKTNKMEKMVQAIPGPPTLPIIGNAHLFMGLDMQGIIDKQIQLLEEYGRTLRFWLGPFLWVNLSEPEHLKAMLTSEIATKKDPTYQFFKDQSQGIFIAEGAEWKQLRKLINPTFNLKLLEDFLSCFNEQSNILLNELESESDKPEFDIHKYIARCTLDIICGTQMGVTSQEQINNTSNFGENLSASLKIIRLRFYKIHLQFGSIFYRTERSRKLKQHVSKLHKFVEHIIQQRRILKEKDESIEDNLTYGKKNSIYLDQLLNHFKNLSDEELTIKVTDFVIAGSDTTGVAISYALILLGRYPDIQEKVYKEIVETIGTNRYITYLDLSNLVYLEMVLKEVLRLFSVPAIVRKLDRDQIIDENTTLPVGTSVQLALFAVHRDPRYWSHPDEFYPDHFLPENIEKRPKFSYVPFSFGPRSCPGGAFAMMSMKTITAFVIQKYKIKSNFNLKTAEYDNLFMLELKNGYPVQISKR